MGMFRKAGERLRAFDDAYAKAIINSPMYAKDPEGSKIGNIARFFTGTVAGGHPARFVDFIDDATGKSLDRNNLGTAEKVFGVALPAVSTAVRYGAPAGGIALAGKGVYDIVQNNIGGEQTPGTVMP